MDTAQRANVPAGLLASLTALTVAFALRVVAQFAQWIADDVSWLPAYDHWQSGALPYGVLVAAQILVLMVQAIVIAELRRGRLRPSERLAPVLFGVGLAYLAVMGFRLAAALTFADGGWLDEPLPSFFHIVLSLFVILWALSGYAALPDRAPAAIRHGVYPFLTVATCSAFYVMAKSGVHPALAAYIPVALGVGAIVFVEWRWPYRKDWVPSFTNLGPDAVFLIAVQVTLPAALAGGYVLVADGLAEGGWRLRELWPHSLPATLQVVLMVLAADLFRYPLHRAMHARPKMWRLHAVHHSPSRLYWLNVGRFHPLEKIAQGLLDALPFVILGVDDWVLAGYFVFYAVNGFFQHSNADVELGPLNWVISGPELHRWHHSVLPAESSTNYGNNVIVWDVLFRTRRLPTAGVGTLGNGDPNYPDGFAASLTHPFQAATP